QASRLLNARRPSRQGREGRPWPTADTAPGGRSFPRLCNRQDRTALMSTPLPSCAGLRAVDTAHPLRYTCIALVKDARWAVARGRGRDHDAIRQAIVDAAGTAVEQGGVEALRRRADAGAGEVARGRGRDQDAIRQAIVDAAGTAVEQGGVESLTFRRVAAAAGVAPGRVQHYFTDRASLVQACFDNVQDRARSRVEATLAAVEPSPAEVVAAILRTMIPRSPEDFRDLRVVTMFETMALTEPALGRALLEGHAELRRLLIDQVALVLRGPGSELEAAGTTSPETLSDELLATAGGLAIEDLHGHQSRALRPSRAI